MAGRKFRVQFSVGFSTRSITSVSTYSFAGGRSEVAETYFGRFRHP